MTTLRFLRNLICQGDIFDNDCDAGSPLICHNGQNLPPSYDDVVDERQRLITPPPSAPIPIPISTVPSTQSVMDMLYPSGSSRSLTGRSSSTSSLSSTTSSDVDTPPYPSARAPVISEAPSGAAPLTLPNIPCGPCGAVDPDALPPYSRYDMNPRIIAVNMMLVHNVEDLDSALNPHFEHAPYVRHPVAPMYTCI